MQESHPIPGDAALRTWHGLLQRVIARRGQNGAFHLLLVRVVPEPALARFVTLDDRVEGGDRVLPGVPGRRGIATPDMAALGAATEVEPPPAGCETFDTAGAARRNRGIDQDVVHPLNLALPPAICCPQSPKTWASRRSGSQLSGDALNHVTLNCTLADPASDETAGATSMTDGSGKGRTPFRQGPKTLWSRPTHLRAASRPPPNRLGRPRIGGRPGSPGLPNRGTGQGWRGNRRWCSRR